MTRKLSEDRNKRQTLSKWIFKKTRHSSKHSYKKFALKLKHVKSKSSQKKSGISAQRVLTDRKWNISGL